MIALRHGEGFYSSAAGLEASDAELWPPTRPAFWSHTSQFPQARTPYRSASDAVCGGLLGRCMGSVLKRGIRRAAVATLTVSPVVNPKVETG
jgi:hypothetical protein